MSICDFNLLEKLGLKASQYQSWLELESASEPQRVAAVLRGSCDSIALHEEQDSEGSATPVPKLTQQRVQLLPRTQVAVGDWIVVGQGERSGLVEHVLPRHSWIRRGGADDSSQIQPIAANLDTVFVVVARAEREKLQKRALNTRRIERFLWLVREGGATPVLLVNKQDVGSEVSLAELSRTLGGLEIHEVSAASALNLECLDPYLGAGQTVAFIGPSGVGKSTLINRLLMEGVQLTAPVKQGDAKGRHTTTRGQLLKMPGGAWLVDTPGLKAVAVVSEDGQQVGFDDVDLLAAQCRFTDCQHQGEPGCAVAPAIEAGDLPAERLESYLALGRDARRHAARHDSYARHLQNKEFRRFTRMVKSAVSAKKR